jgi:hypothetical protein
MLFDFIHPVLNCAETFSVSDVVGHDYTVSTLIVRACDRLKSLLSCCVPLKQESMKTEIYTIWSLIVLLSTSMVLIFYIMLMNLIILRSRLQLWA